MKMFRCCCGRSYAIGEKMAYGPIYPHGIKESADVLAGELHTMTRKEFWDKCKDCAECHSGMHHHGESDALPDTGRTGC